MGSFLGCLGRSSRLLWETGLRIGTGLRFVPRLTGIFGGAGFAGASFLFASELDFLLESRVCFCLSRDLNVNMSLFEISDKHII